MRATRAIIHLNHLTHNLVAFRRCVGPVAIALAAKANGYGHGSEAVARTALKAGVTCLGVATVDEGLALREAKINARIMLLGLIDPTEAIDVAAGGMEAMCVDLASLAVLDRAGRQAGRRIAVHLKVDTGMGRIGCTPEDAPGLAGEISASAGLTLKGVCTHFARADELDQQSIRAQLDRFIACAAPIRRTFPEVVLHAANSAAAVAFPESRLDMVRPGIVCYGYPPSAPLAGRLELKPVMEWCTRIAFLKRVAAGTPISYGATYRTRKETVIATLPVGYGDGYPRALGGRATVLVGATRYPVVGRVCMDQCMVDLGGANPPVDLNQDVVLFGPQPGAPTATELADILGTIAYEITCGVGQRVPRILSTGA